METAALLAPVTAVEFLQEIFLLSGEWVGAEGTTLVSFRFLGFLFVFRGC